jgi:hypothetical protein
MYNTSSKFVMKLHNENTLTRRMSTVAHFAQPVLIPPYTFRGGWRRPWGQAEEWSKPGMSSRISEYFERKQVLKELNMPSIDTKNYYYYYYYYCSRSRFSQTHWIELNYINCLVLYFVCMYFVLLYSCSGCNWSPGCHVAMLHENKY